MPRSFQPISLNGPPEPPVLAGLTVNVTGTVAVWLFPVTVMVPVKVPAESPVTTEDTVNVAGVVPVAGETFSQEALPALAVNVVFGLAVSDRVCPAGEVPPAVAENESELGLTPSVVEAAFTVNVTATLTVRPLPVTLMVPVNVPADNPLTVGDTVKLAGVVPVEGETFNHVPPLTLAVKAVFGLADNDRLFDAGDVPPAVAEKDSDVGLTANVLTAEIVNDTGTVTLCDSPYLIWIVPL